MFNIRRNQKGEILLDISFNPFNFFYNTFSGLDYIFSSKIFYTIPTGLGLGFGFALIVFSQPTTIQADNFITDDKLNNLVAKEIIIENQNFSTNLTKQYSYTLLPLKWNNSNVFFESFPNQNGQLMIGSKDIEIEELKLGEKVTIIGENNGKYIFSIFEIKQLNNNEINYLITDNQSKVIILSPENSLGTRYLSALAR